MNMLRKGASLCVLLLALLTTGCVQTRTAGPTASYETTFYELNWQTATRKATVQLNNGKRYPAQALRLRPDSATWFDPTTGIHMSVPTSWVTKVSVAQPGRGALRGLGIGAGVGAITGALFGVVTHEPNLVLRQSEAALIGALVFGGAGLLVGSAVGALSSRRVYHPDPPPPLPDEPTEDPSDAPTIRQR